MFVIAAIMCPPSGADGNMPRVEFGPVLERSEAIVIIKLPPRPAPAVPIEAIVRETIKGGEGRGETIRLRLPLPDLEGGPTPATKEDELLLACLRRRTDGVYVATTAINRVSRLTDAGDVIEEVVYSPNSGHQSFRVLREADASSAANLVRGFLRWGRLSPEERERLVSTSLEGPEVMRRIALHWLIVDRGLDPAAIADSGEIIAGLSQCSESSDLQIKYDALLAIRFAATHDRRYIKYLIPALDDPLTRDFAIASLDGTRGGPGPILAPSADVEEKIATIKEWWSKH